MEGRVRAVETLYHLKKENDYVQMTLSCLQVNEYEVCVRYSNSIDFDDFHTGDVYILSNLHEAMNVYRDCYVAMLQDGYCYWGLIPAQKSEWERTVEKNRLLTLAQHYCHSDALHTLRAWRDDQAKQEEIRHSAVLSDRSLRSLATFLPQNREELANCPGIGEAKQKRYGHMLLQLCSPYKRRFTAPLSSVLPKYKLKDGEEERFLPYQGKRIPAKDPHQLRERALYIGETGLDVDQLAMLSRVDDRETRRRVASAANKLRLPEVTRSISHLLFDEGPQVRQYMLRAVISSKLRREMANDVRRLLAIEPKPYNQILCNRILSKKKAMELI